MSKVTAAKKNRKTKIRRLLCYIVKWHQTVLPLLTCCRVNGSDSCDILSRSRNAACGITCNHTTYRMSGSYSLMRVNQNIYH